MDLMLVTRLKVGDLRCSNNLGKKFLCLKYLLYSTESCWLHILNMFLKFMKINCEYIVMNEGCP